MTKNILLLVALFAFCPVVQAMQTAAHDAKIFTLEYTVQPKSSDDFTDWNNANSSLMDHVNKTTKGNSNNFYDNILLFVKEMQEAIAAGLNLFGSISTSQQSLGEIIQEVAIEALQEEAAAKANENDTTASSKSLEEESAAPQEFAAIEEVLSKDEEEVIPTITISLSLIATNEFEQEAWTTAKEMLQTFANEAAQGELTPEDFAEKLGTIFKFVEKSVLQGSLQISSNAA